MIIAIRGKIGSGKDTVAKYILEYLYKEKLKGCSIGDSSLLTLAHLERDTNWKIKKFAFKLRQIASLLLNEPIEKFEDQEFKKTKLGKEWNEMTVREFLTKLGTECLRDNLHKDIWINSLLSEYSYHNKYNNVSDRSKMEVEQIFPNWIITDLRFNNEYERLRELNTIFINVKRKDNPHTQINHSSENELEDQKFDCTIINNSTLDDLRSHVFGLCYQLQLK